jgi:hypothetical protein
LITVLLKLTLKKLNNSLLKKNHNKYIIDIVFSITKLQNISFFLINYIIFLKKFKKLYKFKSFKSTDLNILKATIFFKKSNLFFKENLFSKSYVKNKMLKNAKNNYRIRGKRKYNTTESLGQLVHSSKLNTTPGIKNKLKFYKLKDNFYKKLKLNVSLIKGFFLKKSEKKKKIHFFFKNMGHKKKANKIPLKHNIYVNLLQSQFFFYQDDLKFFLKRGLIFVNGYSSNNPLFSLKVGDRIQLVYSKVYYLYIKKVFKFFRKKIKHLRYKRWRFNKFFLRNLYKQ